MSDLWKDLRNSDVWVEWPILGPISGLIVEAGLVDNSPLERFLTSKLSMFEKYERRISLGASNVNTGAFEVFD